MKQGLALLAAVAAICSAGLANADAAVLLYDEATKTSNQVDAQATVGRHFWMRLHDELTPCPWYACPSSYVGGIAINTDHGVAIEPGTGFTVISIASGQNGIGEFARVRLDDGRVGFLHAFSWNTEDPKVTMDRFKAELKRKYDEIDAETRTSTKEVLDRIRAHDQQMAALAAKNCTGGSLTIGATHDEAIRAWCYADKINTTETAFGTREQWVYRYPPHHPHLGYLYFENGRLVAIERQN